MKAHRFQPARNQQGVALITAILLVALATLVAAKLSWDNNIGIRRTESTLMMEQAQMFALGAEAVAIDILRQDKNLGVDNPSDDWAQSAPPVQIGIEEITMGQMVGALSVANGKLNVNNLIPDEDGEIRQQFERLFQSLNLNPGLVDAIIDWIDSNTIPEPGGAEDGIYTALTPPYRPANSFMTSITELRAINGVDLETYERLLPHLTALHPDWCGSRGGVTLVNVNFATAEVLNALDEDISPGQADAWIEERGEDGWENLTDMGEIPTGLDRYAAVNSSCLELNVTVNVGSSVLSMYSLLDRSGGGEDIVTRVRAYGLD